MGQNSEAGLNKKYVDLAKQVNLYLNHFPKHEKYALSQQIRNELYEMYGFIIESQKRYHKKTTLTNLDISHEKLRMFVNLAYNLGYFEFNDGKHLEESREIVATKRYFVLNRMIDEIGRMIGGWIKSEKTD